MVGKALYKSQDEADRAVVDAVAALAAECGTPMASIGLAWHFAKTEVTAPIIGATRPAHIMDAVKALDITLSPQEIAQLEALYRPKFPTGMGMPMMPAMDRVSVLRSGRADARRRHL